MTATAPNVAAEHWQALDRRHHLHPFTDAAALNARGSRMITHAEGVYLWDAEGRRLLDAMAGLWCVNVGYGRRELVEAATAQLEKLPYYNTFFQCSHPPATELAALLAEITPAGMDHVFFTNSGSEANDTVIRMARHYWAARGRPDKQVLISRRNAYHGSTMGGASLGGMAPMHAQGGLPIAGIEHIDEPNWFASDRRLDREAFGVEMARALERRIDALGAEHVAAFVAEPVQGAGGVIVPPDSYWPEIQRICRERDILLVVDEVICGFGRLGQWFGSDYYGLEPDLMPIAKGLSSGYQPIGGVVVRDTVADVLVDAGGEFCHGFTYSGHPVACAVAAANVRLMRDEGLIARARDEIAPHLQRRWRELGSHPLAAEVRGVGLLGGLELDREAAQGTHYERAGALGTLCRDLAVEHGVVMRSVGDALVVSPPLVITCAQIDDLVDRARMVLDEAASRLTGS
ncbi:aminotransferase [Arhodomonas sp. AD133]|uniref:aminotransferase n=1 Tax=Arhodomonas sp. AD133 TaxID=3415009 RepID=UPI003EBE0603